jgi:RNA polymerase sigma factor (sigma-70 family)
LRATTEDTLAPARKAGANHLSDEEQVHRHAVGVWRFLRALGAAPPVADELCQEAFVVAWQKGMQRLEPRALGAFLRRTARHLWLRRHAADRRNRELFLELAKLGEDAELLWQRDCADDGEELVEAARRCVALMRGRARSAVELCYRDGCGRAEAAARLGMKENGVKTLLQRSRQWLKSCIERARNGERP